MGLYFQSPSIPRGGSRNFEKGVHKILGSRITVFRLWPLFESSVVASLWMFVLHSRAQPCIRPYGDTHRMTQYLLFGLKTKCLKCYTMYNNTLLNYYPACRSHKQFFLQKILDPKWMYGWVRVVRPFNSISVISRRWKGEHERLCAMKHRLGSGRISLPVGFEPATPWSEVGSADRSATRTLPDPKWNYWVREKT